MVQIEEQPDGPTEPFIDLVNMELEASFEMATYSLSHLEALSYSTRSVIAHQSDAQAHVFGHWKNFKIHFLYFQDMETPPYKRTISLLKRLRALLGDDVPIHVKADVQRMVTPKRAKVLKSRKPIRFANFYLGMLYRDIKAGKC